MRLCVPWSGLLVAAPVVAAVLVVPSSAFAESQAWKLTHVRAEFRLHVEDTRAPCTGDDDPRVASGDYHTGLIGRRASFGRGYGLYNGVFGSVIGGFLVDSRISRRAAERVRVARLVHDEATGAETCVVEESTCEGERAGRSKGALGIGFRPRRRGVRLGPVVAELSGAPAHFHSCAAAADDPIEFLRATTGPRGSTGLPRVMKRVPFSRFRRRSVHITMRGSAPLREPHGGDLTGTLAWRLDWTLRRTVVPWEGCEERGRPSGFVCEVVG
jgi:hypothetical protein